MESLRPSELHSKRLSQKKERQREWRRWKRQTGLLTDFINQAFTYLEKMLALSTTLFFSLLPPRFSTMGVFISSTIKEWSSIWPSLPAPNPFEQMEKSYGTCYSLPL
jgi:hypothetical protein